MSKLWNENREWAEQIWQKLRTKMQAECERIGSNIPYIPDNGRYEDIGEKDIAWWTNGFWPGMLWQMHQATGEEAYKVAAQKVEERLDRAFEEHTGLHHDVGFMWLHSAVANYRMSGDEKSRIRGLHAADVLASRYNPTGRYIVAWNGDKPGWMIVDCLMNIPLLYWATEETGDPRYRSIAEAHLETVETYMLRPDGSSNHIVIMDPVTGKFVDNPAGQGYASGSSWSRGQSWAVYGMALSYRYTKNERYLDMAKRAAHYFIANAALTGYIPVVDFRAPEEPLRYDTTAGVCAACGMLEIAEHVPAEEKQMYEDAAIRIFMAIEQECCDWNPDTDGIVQKGTVEYHREIENEVPIIYGDYFFIEGILRLLDKHFMIW